MNFSAVDDDTLKALYYALVQVTDPEYPAIENEMVRRGLIGRA